MSNRTILHLLEDVLKAIESIERFVYQMDFEAFEFDEKTIRAVEREFEIIGEAVKKLPDTFTMKYPDVSWKAIAGMRDRLIHHYWETEVEILWKTIELPMPQLKNVIEDMIKNIS
jgi:uncharacterized protein with HEPN domain